MQCETVMIGTELLLGQVVDTNAAFIGQVLAEHGINLFQKTTVGDNPARIRKALDLALDRADVLLISGGLGPTEDDITRECIAELLGRPLEFRPELYETLVARFAHLRAPITENNRKQAFAPRGAVAIENPRGTAPGLIIEDARGVLICMPGVPGELEPMLTERVIPYLRRKFGLSGVIHSRVLKVCGMGESRVDAAIGDLIQAQQNPTIGLLANPDAVRIRITARAETLEQAETLIDAVDARVRERLPGLVMGINDSVIERVVDSLLQERAWRLALGETATGGRIAQRLAAEGCGSFAGSIVIPPRGVSASGSARALAERARELFPAECALGIWTDPAGTRTDGCLLTPEGDREWVIPYAGTDSRGQTRISVTALEYVRRHLTGVAFT